MVRSCKLQLMPVRKHVVFEIICLRGEVGVSGDRGHHPVKRTHRCRHRWRSRAPAGRAYTWSLMIAFNLADICICSQRSFVNDFRVCFLPHCRPSRSTGSRRTDILLRWVMSDQNIKVCLPPLEKDSSQEFGFPYSLLQQQIEYMPEGTNRII